MVAGVWSLEIVLVCRPRAFSMGRRVRAADARTALRRGRCEQSERPSGRSESGRPVPRATAAERERASGFVGHLER